jgi:hypothetical protein
MDQYNLQLISLTNLLDDEGLGYGIEQWGWAS